MDKVVLRLPDSWSNWNLKMLVFEERGKPEYPEKNLSEQRREPTIQSKWQIFYKLQHRCCMIRIITDVVEKSLSFCVEKMQNLITHYFSTGN